MSRYNPHHPNAPRVFAAAQAFAKRCLVEQRSLFLSDAHPLCLRVWQPETFSEILERYVDRPDIGEGTFVEKLAVQMDGASPQSIALMAEIAWVVNLAVTNLGPENKRERIATIWGMGAAGLPEFPSGVEALSDDVLSALGSGGQGFNNYFWRELVFAIRSLGGFVALPVAERQTLLTEPWAFAVWLNRAPNADGRQFYHCLCHLLFPDEFERIFSAAHKTKILRAFARWQPSFDRERPVQDRELLALRRHHETEQGANIDYYYPPLSDALEEAEVRMAGGQETPAGDQAGKVEVILGVPQSERSLEPGRNVIYFGVPGTGKTRVLEELRQKAYAQGDYFLFVCFHPSYSYEDFVVGLRPVVTNGAVAVERVDGPFVRLCALAHADPQRRFVLFIDEINRANTAKVFGELISLIEPARRVPPGTIGKQDHLSVTVSLLDEPLSVPSNLDIYATMNSADKSLVHLDTALRRRFEFVEIAPDPTAIEPGSVEGVDLRALLARINERLEWLLDREHRIGHALLLGIGSLEMLRARFASGIIPLLEEYFFEDRAKVGLALLGRSDGKPFVEKRTINPFKLFSEPALASEEVRHTFVVGDPASWTATDFMRIYDGVPKETTT